MRLRRPGPTLAALFAIVSAVLIGCAATPGKTSTAPEQAAARASRIEANLRAAEQLMEVASASSLARAGELLATEDLRTTAAGAQLAAFGSRLFGSLYPELPNPYPVQAGSSEQSAPAGSRFFQLVGPALSLLAPGPAPDEQHAADILGALTVADTVNKDSVLPPYLRARLLRREGKPPETIRPLYEECLRRDPSFYPAKRGIIETAIDQGTAAADQQVLLKEAAELPTPVAAQTAIVRIYLAAGQPQQAADAAARALLLAPDSSDLAILRARAFEDMGDWYQALSILDGLLSIVPDNAGALAMKATLLFEKAGNPDRAMQILSQAEAKFPDDPAFPELRGRILLSRGNDAEGEAALEAALKLDPARVSTLALLAGSAARSQRWQEASGYLERIPASERSPELLQLAWRIAVNLADYDQALAIARTLEKKKGGDAAQVLVVRTLIAADRAQEARDLATADLKTATTPSLRSSLYVLRALAGRRAGGDTDAALRDLRAAVRENPDDREALLAIADALSEAHEYRKALGYLKHAQDLSPDDAAIRARVTEASRLAGP